MRTVIFYALYFVLVLDNPEVILMYKPNGIFELQVNK